MRISDWSSDVCSSDLRHAPPHAPCRQASGRARGEAVRRPGSASGHAQHRMVALPRRVFQRCGDIAGFEQRIVLQYLLTADRKSVVSGKSVSVRVDLGGRRIIKKKNIITESIAK